MSEIIFNSTNYTTKNNMNIIYHKPKKEEGKYLSKMYYLKENEKNKILYETGKIVLEDGIQFNSSGGAYIKFIIDENNIDLHEFLIEMDELIVSKVWQNSKSWFSKKQQIDADLIDEYYRSILKVSSKYAKVVVKFQISKEKLSEIVCCNQYSKRLEITSLPSNSKVKLQFQLVGICFGNNKFFPIYEIKRITYYQQRTINSHENEFMFSDDDDDIFTINDNSEDEDFAEFEYNNENYVNDYYNNDNDKLNEIDDILEEQMDEDVGVDKDEDEDEENKNENSQSKITLLISDNIKDVLDHSNDKTQNHEVDISNNSTSAILSEKEEVNKNKGKNEKKEKKVKKTIVIRYKKKRTYFSNQV